MDSRFNDLFPVSKPIIGMLHLAGTSPRNRVSRALDEIEIYASKGVDGVIVEDYHGTKGDVKKVLEACSGRDLGVVVGVNLLSDPLSSFGLAEKFGARFVQLDSVQSSHMNTCTYDAVRAIHHRIVVLGGVRFKYLSSTGNSLAQDVNDALPRCDAIVTTGTGTGIETPLYKLQSFREIMPYSVPLIVGAGVTAENAYRQLSIADAAIVGSYCRLEGNTFAPVDSHRVGELMDVVREVRNS